MRFTLQIRKRSFGRGEARLAPTTDIPYYFLEDH
jgi:hypothetical protein